MTATSSSPRLSPDPSGDAVSAATVARAARVARCSWRLYDAECAVHAAHQSHVDGWIAAADAKLHDAVVEYETALATGAGPADESCPDAADPGGTDRTGQSG